MDSLSETGKKLYEALYLPGKANGTGEHPLERYVKAIDENLGDNTILVMLARRIGLYTQDVQNWDASVTLPETLLEYLKDEKDVAFTREKLNFPFNSFLALYPDRTEDWVQDLYDARLLLNKESFQPRRP